MSYLHLEGTNFVQQTNCIVGKYPIFMFHHYVGSNPPGGLRPKIMAYFAFEDLLGTFIVRGSPMLKQ